MGNEQSGKYVVKYPAGFNEKHTEVDNGLSYFKNDLAAAQRSGRAANGIRQRAENRKKLKGFEMDINRMEGMKVDAMADTKAKKYREEDFARWQEMMDGLKALYLECKSLVEGNARTRSAKKDDRATADDFLRGDGAATPAGTDENRSAQLRTGKMSEQEKQAMQEINDKDEVMDDLTDQITENLEFLHMRAEMIGEEIDSQKDLVQEVCCVERVGLPRGLLSFARGQASSRVTAALLCFSAWCVLCLCAGQLTRCQNEEPHPRPQW